MTFTTVARVAAAEAVAGGTRASAGDRVAFVRQAGQRQPRPGVGVLTRQALHVCAFVVNLESLQSPLVAASRVHRVLELGDQLAFLLGHMVAVDLLGASTRVPP